MSDAMSTRSGQRGRASDGKRPPAAVDWSRAVSLDELVSQLAQGYKTIGEMVYEVIKQAILNATFAPGERLRQEALATAIGVSRIPVRSALIQLESEGLVAFHPRRGAVVRSLTPAQIREIYELRELLEVHALRKAMATFDDERVAKLRKLASDLDTKDEGSGFVDLRVEFYRVLYDADNNPQLVKLIEELRSGVGRYLLGWRKVSDYDQHGTHRDLLEHVVSGNVDEAERSLRDHLHQVRSGVEQIMTSQLGEKASDSRKPVKRSGKGMR